MPRPTTTEPQAVSAAEWQKRHREIAFSPGTPRFELSGLFGRDIELGFEVYADSEALDPFLGFALELGGGAASLRIHEPSQLLTIAAAAIAASKALEAAQAERKEEKEQAARDAERDYLEEEEHQCALGVGAMIDTAASIRKGA